MLDTSFLDQFRQAVEAAKKSGKVNRPKIKEIEQKLNDVETCYIQLQTMIDTVEQNPPSSEQLDETMHELEATTTHYQEKVAALKACMDDLYRNT